MIYAGSNRNRAFRTLTSLQNEEKTVRKPDCDLTYDKGHIRLQMLSNVKCPAQKRHADTSLKIRRATAASLSDGLHNPVAGISREQSYGETHHRIGSTLREPVVGKQRVVLVHERGESGETATETCGEEHAQVTVHYTAALEQTVEQAYEETTENVYNHRSPRKPRGDVGLHHVRKKISGHSADETSRTDKKYCSYHWNILRFKMIAHHTHIRNVTHRFLTATTVNADDS